MIPNATPTPLSRFCNRAASWCARWRVTGCRRICGSRSAPARRWKRSPPRSRNSWGGDEGAAMSNRLFDTVALIGIGLIGSSLARVLRRDCPQTRIVACARRAETLAAVRRLHLADETTDDPAAAACGADLVVLAPPLSA